jgi:hypothetical protein
MQHIGTVNSKLSKPPNAISVFFANGSSEWRFESSKIIKNCTQSADGQHFKWMQCTGKARRLVSVIAFETAGSTRSLKMGRHGQLTMEEKVIPIVLGIPYIGCVHMSKYMYHIVH